jgi:hypothetical protein
MWNKPTEKQLNALPKFYSTENIKAENKIIKMHFFMGGSDWYIAEYDPESRQFFGYAVINGDDQMGEWGYVSYDELLQIKMGFQEVDRDLHWTPKKFKDIIPMGLRKKVERADRVH